MAVRLLSWPGSEDPFSTSQSADEVTKTESTAAAMSLLLTNTSHIHDASDVVALANSQSPKLSQNTVSDLHRLTLDHIWSTIPPQHFPSPPPPEGQKEQQKQQMLNLLHGWALSAPIQRALATQMSFSRGQPASVTSQNAWLLLSLRHTLCLSMWATNSPSDTGSSDVPITLVAVVEWFLDFLGEMLDELVTASEQAGRTRTVNEVAGGMSE